MTVLTAVLTVVLVVITGYYAWQTRQTVVEMRDARRMTMMPKLVVDMRSEGTGFVPPSVCNLGQGPALDVDVTISFEPLGELSDVQGITRRWRSPLVAPGERHRFHPPTDQIGQSLRMDRIAHLFGRVCLTGSCQTSFGQTLSITEEVGDLQELWELAKSSEHLLDDDSPGKIVAELHKIRRALEESVPKSDPAEQQRRAAASKALFEEVHATEAAGRLPDDGRR